MIFWYCEDWCFLDLGTPCKHKSWSVDIVCSIKSILLFFIFKPKGKIPQFIFLFFIYLLWSSVVWYYFWNVIIPLSVKVMILKNHLIITPLICRTYIQVRRIWEFLFFWHFYLITTSKHKLIIPFILFYIFLEGGGGQYNYRAFKRCKKNVHFSWIFLS